MNEYKSTKIFFNLLFCLGSCMLSIIDNINCWEYIISAKYSTTLLRFLIMLSALIHPFSLFLYHCLSLTYVYYLEEEDFKNLILEKEFYEMIYFRTQVRKYNFLIIPFALYLTVLSYTKFFSFYSLKFLIETPSSFEVFFNVITTTLYNPILIQVISQSFPQIILQTTNNLLNMEHNHAFHFKGVVNFSTIISLLYIINLCFLYLRDKKHFIEADREQQNNTLKSSNISTLDNQSIGNINELNAVEYSQINNANRNFNRNSNENNNHFLN